jgi:hypothetical protein
MRTLDLFALLNDVLAILSEVYSFRSRAWLFISWEIKEVQFLIPGIDGRTIFLLFCVGFKGRCLQPLPLNTNVVGAEPHVRLGILDFSQ